MVELTAAKLNELHPFVIFFILLLTVNSFTF
jgi:hypothetical protein